MEREIYRFIYVRLCGYLCVCVYIYVHRNIYKYMLLVFFIKLLSKQLTLKCSVMASMRIKKQQIKMRAF